MKKIVFFDGVCNLCNGFVDFVIRRDTAKEIYFCSLQSKQAKELLKSYHIQVSDELSTIYFLKDNKLYHKSDAVLQIFKEFSSGYVFLSGILSLLPSFIRNSIYDLVAKNRYRILGKKESCRMPTMEERKQFL